MSDAPELWKVVIALEATAEQKDGGINPKKGEAKDYFFKAAHQFGLGKEAGVDLPNEVTGRIPDRQWKQEYWEANKDAWCKTGKKDGSYVEKIAYENCLDGNKMRAGDEINYSIGQGDTLVTPIQMATIYAAIANGGTLYDPTVGKAIVSADGKTVQEIKPKARCNGAVVSVLNELADYLRDKQAAMVADLKKAGVKVAYADPIAKFEGHGLCDSDEWINGIVAGPEGEGDFHSGDDVQTICWWVNTCLSRESFHPKPSGTTGYAAVMRDTLDSIGYKGS